MLYGYFIFTFIILFSILGNIMSSKEVVPGDVLLLREDTIGRMEADAVLLEGSVITNEAMLTGESIPITKVNYCLFNITSFIQNSDRFLSVY